MEEKLKMPADVMEVLDRKIKVPFISVVLPVYNEEVLIKKSLGIISNYIATTEGKYSWEIIIVNDGSRDNTGTIADELAKGNPIVRVIHHPMNLNLGRALQTGFRHALGDIIIVLDLDQSYSVDHIGRLIETQIETNADIVIASPYMKEGKVTGVPFKRALLSRVANRFMRLAAQEKLHTFTGMVRAYKASFIKNLNLKSKDFDISPEILYKAMILRAIIIEIPAHLDWSLQNSFGKKRVSGMKVVKSFFSSLMAGFIFRPYLFFLVIGSILLIISLYIISWIFIHTFQIMPTLQIDPKFFDDKFSIALGNVFQQRPHAFFIGGISLLAAMQILSLGFISLQQKRYYEELFHISTSVFKRVRSKFVTNQDNEL